MWDIDRNVGLVSWQKRPYPDQPSFFWAVFPDFEHRVLGQPMTALLPQLPRVWAFQAMKLSYDVSGEAPLEERFRWIVEGVRLLRDDARRFNLSSPRLYQTIALIFLQRIGGDVDPAHFVFKNQLARLFEGDSEARLVEWGIDESFLRQLTSRYRGAGGAPLADLRSPYAHALYWSEIGLKISRPQEDAAAHNMLSHFRVFAIRQLAARGLVLRQPGGEQYAVLPDLRFSAAATETLEEQLREFAGVVSVVEDLKGDRERYRQWLVVHQAVWGRFKQAKATFETTLVSREVDSLEDFLRGALVPEARTLVAAELRELQIGLLRTAACLLVAEPADESVTLTGAVLGFAGLARLIQDSSEAEMIALSDSVVRAMTRRWSASPGLEPLAARLAAATEFREEGETVDLQRPPVLPDAFDAWNLEALDPEFRREVEP